MRNLILVALLLVLTSQTCHAYCVKKKDENPTLRRPVAAEFQEFLERFKEWQKRMDKQRQEALRKRLQKELKKFDLKKMIEEMDKEIDRSLKELD